MQWVAAQPAKIVFLKIESDSNQSGFLSSSVIEFFVVVDLKKKTIVLSCSLLSAVSYLTHLSGSLNTSSILNVLSRLLYKAEKALWEKLFNTCPDQMMVYVLYFWMSGLVFCKYLFCLKTTGYNSLRPLFFRDYRAPGLVASPFVDRQVHEAEH